ncbi:MAG TPA: sulfur carrier protein ThiS [Solirubrobacteraceae bacterium]|nr:sulfur carrier protein ThiS [Solirubrobacteraceae bacterium]
MRVIINGELHELDADASLTDAISALRDPREGRGLAAALDGEVVPRGRWSETRLSEGARIELVVAVQGG